MTTEKRFYSAWNPWRISELQRIVSVFQENPKTTTKELAEKLGVSKSTVNRMINCCKQKFMLPRVPKRQWTKELIQEAVDYQKSAYEKRLEIVRYGECPNCGKTGKDLRQYRKLTKKGYWTLYKICAKCGVMFGVKIVSDSHVDRRIEAVDELAATGFFKRGYISMFPADFEDNLDLVTSILKKVDKGEYVPGDQLEMADKWIAKVKGNRTL